MALSLSGFRCAAFMANHHHRPVQEPGYNILGLQASMYLIEKFFTEAVNVTRVLTRSLTTWRSANELQ